MIQVIACVNIALVIGALITSYRARQESEEAMRIWRQIVEQQEELADYWRK